MSRFALVALAAFFFGCKTEPTTHRPGDSDAPRVATLGAGADGGILTALDGTAYLNVPAGALASGVTITLVVRDPSTQPHGETLSSMVYDFSPADLTFTVPARLTIHPTTAPSAGEEVSIVVLEGDEWVDVQGSSLVDGLVTAPISHLGKFAVRYSALTGFTCDGFNFTACGGDVVGTWNLAAFCPDATTTGFEQFPGCDDVASNLDSTVSGTLVFNQDGSYSRDTSATLAGIVTIDDDCLANLSFFADTPSDQCSYAANLVSNRLGGTADCIYDADCTCNVDVDTTDQGQGTWEVDGTDLIVDGGSPAPFCSAGGQFSYRISGGNTPRYAVFMP